MAPVPHTIDPNWDTIITLKRASTNFAPWDISAPIAPEAWHPQPTVLRKKMGKKQKLNGSIGWKERSRIESAEDVVAANANDEASVSLFGDKAATEADESQITSAKSMAQGRAVAEDFPMDAPKPMEEEGIHYRVSSRHMMLASKNQRASLGKDQWSESSRCEDDGSFHISAEDWDAEAFLIFLNAIHLRNKKVPRAVNLEMLAKIAVVVDYYHGAEAIELYSEMWIKELKAQTVLPQTYCRDLVLWICIAWVFDDAELLQRASAVAIRHSTGSFRDLGLPIVESISREIELQRYQAINCVIEGLHSLLDKYRSSGYLCPLQNAYSFQCGAFLLGALTKELDTHGLLSPRPEIPFPQLSLESICGKIRTLKSPVWAVVVQYNHYGNNQHGCNLDTAVGAVITSAEAAVVGLDITSLKAARTRQVGKKS